MRCKSIFLFICMVCLITSAVCAQQSQADFLKADSLYGAGQKKQAQALYQKAAKQGSADAHFALAYKYVISDKERIHHFAKAAKQGHAEAH